MLNCVYLYIGNPNQIQSSSVLTTRHLLMLNACPGKIVTVMKHDLPHPPVIVLYLLFITLFYSTNCYAQKFELEGKRKKYTISFKTAQNLIIIPLYINGKGPYNFLLDTGVGQMIITDTAFLKHYQLKKFSTIRVQGYGFGESVDAILSRDVNASLGKATINKIPTAIFTEDVFNLSSYLGIRIYGILGYYFFNSFKVKINYEKNTITMYRPGTPVKIKGEKVPLEIRNAKPYIQTEIETPEQGKIKLDMLLDNGSSHPMTLEALNQSAFPLPKNNIAANLGVGINGIISGSIARVSKLKIGAYNFDNVLTGFPAYNKEISQLEGNIRNGSIGADILKHFIVTFDYENEAIYLKKNHSGQIKFEHDMAGMEIYVVENNVRRYYIGRIEPDSPAEKAGLHPDDEILSVDLKNMAYYDLSELTELFKSKDGRLMIIEVLRGKDRYFILLRLKRRI